MAPSPERARRGRGRRPRELSHAFSLLRSQVAPPTLLAMVQDRWAAAVGPAVAEEAEPVSERDGVVTVACRSAVWAAELSMLAPKIEASLNEALEGQRSLGSLRFVTRPS